MSTTIESLELEVLSSSQSAESGLNALTTTLEKLKNATKGGAGLTSVIKQIKGLGDAAKTLDATSVYNLNGLTKAISILSNLGGIKLSSSIATQITAIGNSAKSLNGVTFTPFTELATALQPLTAIGKVNLSSAINQLARIPQMATSLSAVDMSGFSGKIREMVTALEPLSQMPKQTISTTLKQIEKIPTIFTSLKSLDMGGFSAKIQELATSLKPLADEMNKIANGFSAFPAKIQRLIANTNSLAVSNNKASSSYINFATKIGTTILAVRKIASAIGSCVTETNEYIENVNLFTVSLGEYAEEAKEYAELVGEIMGIDPGEWMRNQGIFMTLATGFGVVSDRAYIMSQQLTQLGYDLSSFFNISYEDAMLKLQSGLSGELEPLRRLGYDLSQAKLEATALELGITKTVSAMTQAEKAQLRYYAIMTQVTTAQGDMARTLNAPSNQIRVLKSQLTQAARAIGSIFIPALNAILPYAIAVTKVIRILANVIASLFGFEMPEVDYSGIVSASGEVDDNLGDAVESAKKLKTYLLGFDELNVFDPKKDDGTGLENALSQFDFELPTYDFIGDATESRINTIVEEMKKWLGITEDIDTWSELMNTRLGSILKTVGLIGAGIAAWKVTQGFLAAISTLKTLLSTPSYAIAIGVVLTLTGFSIELSGLKDAVINGLGGFNFAEIVSGGLLGTGGLALLGSKIAAWIATAFEGSAIANAIATAGANLGISAAGGVGAALAGAVGGIIAGIPAFFVGIYDACVSGLNWLNGLLIPAGATAASAGIGAIIGALGGPIGAGIGALIGLAVGLVTDGIILLVQNWEAVGKFFTETIPQWWNSIVVGVQNAFSAVGDFFTSLPGTIAQWFDNLWKPIREFDWAGLGYDIGQWFGNAIKSAINFVTVEIPNWIKSVLKAIADGLRQFFTVDLPKFFTETVPGTIKTVIKNIANFFKGLGKAIYDGFYTGITWIINIGTAIIDGIWQGLQSVWKAITDFVGGFVQGFKDALGIHSPSTVFAEIGGFLIDGLFGGMGEAVSVIGTWCYDNIIKPITDAVSGALDGVANFIKGDKTGWLFGIDKKALGTSIADALNDPKVKSALELKAKVKNDSSTWWKNVTSWWNVAKGTLAIGASVTNNAPAWWEQVKGWWNSAKSTNNGKVSNFTTGVTDSSSTWWKNVTSWWKTDSKNGVDLTVNAKKGWKDTLEKALGIAKTTTLDFKLPKVKVEWGTTSLLGFTVPFPKFSTYAQGGFPDMGELFVAREAGAELVGNIGGKTAVVNNDQIVESVSSGVYQAVIAALGNGSSDEGEETRIVINLDGEKIYENQQKVARNRGYNLGMGVFSFG